MPVLAERSRRYTEAMDEFHGLARELLKLEPDLGSSDSYQEARTPEGKAVEARLAELDEILLDPHNDLGFVGYTVQRHSLATRALVKGFGLDYFFYKERPYIGHTKNVVRVLYEGLLPNMQDFPYYGRRVLVVSFGAGDLGQITMMWLVDSNNPHIITIPIAVSTTYVWHNNQTTGSNLGMGKWLMMNQISL